MSDDTRWWAGASVVWRSLPGGSVGTVLTGFVVVDSADVVVLHQPKGAPRLHRTGRRGGPAGRNMLPDGWDGGYRESAFPGPSTIRLHPLGMSFSVIRTWDETQARPRGWYVNLEQPWVRTPIGFDGHDDILDIRASDDLSSWEWKDADELEWSVRVGKVSSEYAAAVRRTGEEVAAMIASGVWPFQESAWSDFKPVGDGLPTVPVQWKRTSDWA